MWVTRLGSIFWGMIAVAVPRSLPNLVGRDWINLLYLFEAMLIVGGILFANSAIQNYGLKLFGLTLAGHFMMTLLGDLMTGAIRKRRLMQWLIALVIVTVLGLSFVEVNLHFKADIRDAMNKAFGAGAYAWVAAHKLLILLIALGGAALLVPGVRLYRRWQGR